MISLESPHTCERIGYKTPEDLYNYLEFLNYSGFSLYYEDSARVLPPSPSRYNFSMTNLSILRKEKINIQEMDSIGE